MTFILSKVSTLISNAISALTKNDVGLGNVDNTSDINKPVSTAQSTAIGLKADKTYVDDKVSISNNRVSDIDEAFSAALNDLNSRLKTDVPEGAKFTDTVVNISHLLPKSGGTLENYVEKLTTTTGAINLNSGNVFHRDATANTTFSITNAKTGAHSFTLIITMGATVRTLTFPASVKWQDGEVPEMTEANKTYILTFMTINSGTTWFGMEGGSF